LKDGIKPVQSALLYRCVISVRLAFVDVHSVREQLVGRNDSLLHEEVTLLYTQRLKMNTLFFLLLWMIVNTASSYS
jgi:hypothetical protein